MDVCTHAVCTRPTLWTACRSCTPSPAPSTDPSGRPVVSHSPYPATNLSTKCNLTLTDTCWCQKYVLSTEWMAWESVCVCLNVAYMNSDCVPVYNIFLLHTAIEEQFYLSVSCKALWVMPPSFQVRLIFNKSCWLRKKHSHQLPWKKCCWDFVASSCPFISKNVVWKNADVSNLKTSKEMFPHQIDIISFCSEWYDLLF